ncbi:MAG: RHS repeat-associated core domain-containing protein [Bryobacteraceae bacterium]|nr:RHS repeat-associated core domain-containing protein [Bryobacteraceae bacterium]
MESQYDQIGRLTWASTPYDGFGNLTRPPVIKGSLTGFTLCMAGQSYDDNGNWLGMWGLTLLYDVDNRVSKAADHYHQETYVYSARNERLVSQCDQDRHRVHFYGADGLLLGIYTLEITQLNPSYTYPVRLADQERVYFGGRLMQIGGEWVATDRLGSVVRKGTTNYKYAPYGQEIGGATANDTVKFATYTRDSVSGLDYALNRYYKPEWGRFTSPDPLQPGIAQRPSSWNYYAYTEGDPINFFDPEGLNRMDPCNPNLSRTGHVDADCSLVLHGGGGGGAFSGFRDTYDSMRWESSMATQRFTNLLRGFGASSGSTPSVTSTVTYPKADPPLNPNAAFVLGRVGQTTQPLTNPYFWAAWTAAAATAGYSSQTLHFYQYLNAGGYGFGYMSPLGGSFVRLDYHKIPGSGSLRVLHLDVRLLGIRKKHWRPWDITQP